MPRKFSYKDLAKDCDRLKREAQRYLDSLDDAVATVDSADSTNVTPALAKESTGSEESKDLGSSGTASGDINGVGNSQCSKSDESNHDDDNDILPEMTFRRNNTLGEDDDSLIAMARRMDDASVISYSSFDVRSHYTNEEEDEEEQPRLALPCSTGNTGMRAKRVYPKEKRLGLDSVKATTKEEMKASASRERRQQRQSMKQVLDDVADITKKFDSVDNDQEAHLRRKSEIKSRSKSRERRRDSKKERKPKVQANGFQENKPNPTRRKTGEESKMNESKTADGKKFYTLDKRNEPNVAQRKDKPVEKRNSRKKNQWNDSECTVQTDNRKENAKRNSSIKINAAVINNTIRSRIGAIERDEGVKSDDESMHGEGYNVRILHNKSQESKSKSKTQRAGIAENRSSFKAKPKTGESTAARRPRSKSTPPTLKPDKSTPSPHADATNTKTGTKGEDEVQSSFYCSSKDEDEVQSVYDSDCNTEFFYESTDDEWMSDEEDLPMVGTSVLKAVEDLNNKSIGVKMKNMLGIRS